ncbi:hypothetical protein [Alicyclobacillus fastidiosus]|uniref:hypothetical protein n=1 Tax=Alicyclobacillus fastidiosus TaxID=392011 RepID=UPI0023EA114A|nr:hypothetical protein [Alicyclobacillus fastidiosus]GMA65947.1 hypothetical protein GCM10025859_63890 [Alicyclobacillus fastidiosus]GMA66167.1 hypothetical protein GCM10025859_66090 [Alicyclobacillus fastidiosus]
MQGRVSTRKSAEVRRALVQGMALACAAAVITDVVAPQEAMAIMSDTDNHDVTAVVAPIGSIESSVMNVKATEGQQLDSMQFNGDASWADYVIPLIRHQALPLTVTMVCWAGLEMILRRPSSALDRAKWAICGYIGMQFVLPFIRHLGHQFGDV